MNDGIVDCLYGTDESPDGKMIKDYIHPQLFHYLFYHGDWKCIDSKTNRVKNCKRSEPEHVFLLSFPHHEIYGCDLFGTRIKFWLCKEASKCVRQGYACVNRNVKGERYCPKGQTPETAFFESTESYCVQKICPKGTWPCHER